MPARLVGLVAFYCYLHLRLCWDLITNMEGVNMGVQRSSRGVRVLSLVEDGVFLCGLIHVRPVRVGCSGGRVYVPEFEDCVFP